MMSHVGVGPAAARKRNAWARPDRRRTDGGGGGGGGGQGKHITSSVLRLPGSPHRGGNTDKLGEKERRECDSPRHRWCDRKKNDDDDTVARRRHV
jgi:hypothetical protein